MFDRLRASAVLVTCLLVAACPTTSTAPQQPLHLTVIGTNDVHGVFLPENGRGGLATLSGYVDAVRAVRDEDGGAVLLIDAGDMWQGTLESNLQEGAPMVEAYNAMRYTAAAIGNHDFDFGPVGDLAIPQSEADDGLSSLKLRATEMEFPLLSANLVDKSTGKLIDWENVSPSTMINVQGIKVGIIGVVTERALVTTMAPNVVGLSVEPITESVIREATTLRADGAQFVIVTAHAGSRCEEFNDPHDLSSCFMDGEIMRVANALPAGLVDHIIAGHTHERIAHFVNGISITSSIARTVTFSRADFMIDRDSGEVLETEIFQPQFPCPFVNTTDGECEWDESKPRVPASYENRPIQADPTVLEIAMRATAYAEEKKSEPLGPYLETIFTTEGNPESPLGNIFTDAMLDQIAGDISIHNVSGGIRAYMHPGAVTFGAVYEAFPFDNRIVVLSLSGSDVRKIVAKQAHNHQRRAGIAGMRIFIDCEDGALSVRMVLNDGHEILDSDRIDVIANDFLVLGGDRIFEPVTPAGGFEFDNNEPLMRDVLVQWFRSQDGRLDPADFLSDEPRWNLPKNLPESCTLPSTQ
jgi:5'-nucleotidase